MEIFKCSLAYLLGSMATFLPPIAALLGNQYGKHVVATVCSYFHPARSQGSMYEAIILALLAFVYAAFISFSSMAVCIAFADRGLKVIGHMVVLVIFCGGGLGFVGWLKQRLQNQLVNLACSLTSLAIITVLTKEGAVQMASFSYAKVVQVLKMVIMGTFVSTFVCLVVKPVSANARLRYLQASHLRNAPQLSLNAGNLWSKQQTVSETCWLWSREASSVVLKNRCIPRLSQRLRIDTEQYLHH